MQEIEQQNTEAKIANNIKQQWMNLGEIKRATKIAKTMKKRGFSDDVIQELTMLSKKELKPILSCVQGKKLTIEE